MAEDKKPSKVLRYFLLAISFIVIFYVTLAFTRSQLAAGIAMVILGAMAADKLGLIKEEKPNYKKQNNYQSVSSATPKITQVNYKPGDVVETFLAGVTFEGRQENIKKLEKLDVIHLIREPLNEYDSNAIKVYAKKNNYLEVGYIPRELSGKIADYFDKYTIKQVPTHGKVIEFSNIDTDHVGVKISFKIPSRESLEGDQMYWVMSNDPIYDRY